jgi:hypothetical protein
MTRVLLAPLASPFVLPPSLLASSGADRAASISSKLKNSTRGKDNKKRKKMQTEA